MLTLLGEIVSKKMTLYTIRFTYICLQFEWQNIPSSKETINCELNKVGGRVYFRKDIGSICLEKYEECGVNINLGNEIVKEIQPFIKNTGRMHQC